MVKKSAANIIGERSDRTVSKLALLTCKNGKMRGGERGEVGGEMER